MSELVCPSCAEAVAATDVYCEVCGYELSQSPPTASTGADGASATGVERGGTVAPAVGGSAAGVVRGGAETPAAEAGTTRPCGSCGAGPEAIDPDGYCGSCGMRQSRVSDHLESDLGWAAAVSDRGLRHHRNEDAYAISVRDERVAVVICDGVSTTANPDQASAAAARVALDAIAAGLGDDEWPGTAAVEELLREAIEQAQKAVAGVPPEEPDGYAALPSTTIVAAVVGPGAAVVANVGDSRAYWLSTVANGSRLLSVDDSWAEGAIAAGVPRVQAYAAPAAHVITQWLGADTTELHPHIESLAIDEPGTLIVCSDGLWNYFESADELADLIGEDRVGTSESSPLSIASRLVEAALGAGGHDNITVAVITGRPAPPVTTQPQE